MKKFFLQTVIATSIASVLVPAGSPIPASAAKSTALTTVHSSVNGPLSGTGEPAAGYIQFLHNKYGIYFSDSMTRGEYIEAVAKIVDFKPEEESFPEFADLSASDLLYPAAAKLYSAGILTSLNVNADAPLTPLSALYIAVKAAGISELGYTYPQNKVDSSLNILGLSKDRFQHNQSAAAEIAAAVDTGLLPSPLYSQARGALPATAEYASVLLGRVLEFNGDYKHSIGRTSDEDIISKLYNAYDTSDLIQAPELRKVVNQALEAGQVTGYNLKDRRYDSNFIEPLTLTYGHDDIKHAKQLIGLLQSEGIQADVSFQPKTSAFIYLREWGEPKETENYKVEQIANGNYIAYAKEYDLSFEFDTAADKIRFNDILLAYAKKNSDDQSGLLHASWWQPLYYSSTAIQDYSPITNNTIVQGNYYAQSFTLSSDAKVVAAAFRELAPDADVESHKLWVDVPFYNYLLGDYK
ncbi:hypothetical protein M3231_16915 [Neobacillus mesonae]|nr:hypothetical protein [Neobacillus mesonae]